MNAFSPTPQRFRMFKRRMLDGLFFVVGGPLIGLILRLLARTVRVGCTDPELFWSIPRMGRPIIWAFWHEDMFGVLFSYLPTRPGRLSVMISRSRDGEKLARVLWPLHIEPVRGSSSRGAVRGIVELKRWLMQGSEVPLMAAMAVDGPRGPRRQSKPGAVMLARQSGAIIVPVAIHSSRQWTFRSWDRTRLPRPFCRLVMNIGEPIDPAGRAEDDHAINAELEARLNELITAEITGSGMYRPVLPRQTR